MCVCVCVCRIEGAKFITFSFSCVRVVTETRVGDDLSPIHLIFLLFLRDLCPSVYKERGRGTHSKAGSTAWCNILFGTEGPVSARFGF